MRPLLPLTLRTTFDSKLFVWYIFEKLNNGHYDAICEDQVGRFRPQRLLKFEGAKCSKSVRFFWRFLQRRNQNKNNARKALRSTERVFKLAFLPFTINMNIVMYAVLFFVICKWFSYDHSQVHRDLFRWGRSEHLHGVRTRGLHCLHTCSVRFLFFGLLLFSVFLIYFLLNNIFRWIALGY